MRTITNATPLADPSNASFNDTFPFKIAIQMTSDSQYWANSAVGSAALVLFDYFLTLDGEITHVWRRSWSLTKILFLFGRYMSILNSLLFANITTVHQTSSTLCQAWNWYYSLGMALTAFVPTTALFTLRLHNLFSDVKYMRYILLALFTLEHAGGIVILSLVASHLRFSPSLWPQVIGCPQVIAGLSYPVIILTTLPNLISTTCYLILVLRKFFSFIGERSHMKGLKSLRDGNQFASAFSLLLRSSVIFYLMCFGAVFTAGAFVLIFKNRSIQSAVYPWVVTIYAIAGSRLVLLLGGDVNDSSGVYKYGNEFRIDVSLDYEMEESMRSFVLNTE